MIPTQTLERQVLTQYVSEGPTATEEQITALVQLFELGTKGETDLLQFVWGRPTPPETEQEALRTKVGIQTLVICQALNALGRTELADIIYQKYIQAQVVRAVALAFSGKR